MSAEILFANLSLRLIKEQLDMTDKDMIDEAIKICRQVDDGSAVYLAVGGTIPEIEMAAKKLKALELIQELREALKDL